MSILTAIPRPEQTGFSRRRPWVSVPAALTGVGLGLALAGVLLPWITIFHGLEPIPGFGLDGGWLLGLAVASVLLSRVASGHPGAGRLRLAAAVIATAVAVDAIYSATRIASFVADPGTIGPLIAPVAGPGALVMAGGGLLLVGAALAAPIRSGVLPAGLGTRLILAGFLFVAGWIHLGLAPEHFGESPLLGLGFASAAAAQLALAVLVVARPSRVWLSMTIVSSVALICLYGYAVLVGLPIDGPTHDAVGLVVGAGEPLDILGATTQVCQLAALGVAAWLSGRLDMPPGVRAEMERGIIG